METINILEVESHHGTRQFRLLEGDIGFVDFPVDLLCVSAYRGGYIPLDKTVLGSLKNIRNIQITHDSINPDLDYRNTMGTFLFPTPADPCIKYILCLEIVGRHETIEAMLENFLLTLYLLELRGFTFRNIMMPLLGTGHQQLDLKQLISVLLKKAGYILKKLSFH